MCLFDIYYKGASGITTGPANPASWGIALKAGSILKILPKIGTLSWFTIHTDFFLSVTKFGKVAYQILIPYSQLISWINQTWVTDDSILVRGFSTIYL